MRCGFDPWIGKIPWRRKWQPTAVFLPGESCGHRSLACCSLWGLKELDTTEWLSTHAVLHHMRGADTLRISKSSTENHLHQLGHVNCFDVWIPHKLSKKTLLDYISACDSLPKHNKNVLFLKQTVTDDEKWTLYSNVEWKRSWGKWNEPPPTILKASLQPKKVMYIWWDWKGVLYYELLLENQTINSNKYCSQLDQLKAALDEKHPELVNRLRISG